MKFYNKSIFLCLSFENKMENIQLSNSTRILHVHLEMFSDFLSYMKFNMNQKTCLAKTTEQDFIVVTWELQWIV